MSENEKGFNYEDFAFQCFTAIYQWAKNCPDIANNLKIKKGVKLQSYNGITTNQIDVYIEYTQPSGLVVKTAIECKKRNIIEISQIRDFNDKLRKIKNIIGIFAYSGTLQKGVIEYAKEEGIALWNIEQLIKEISLKLICIPEQQYDIEFNVEVDKNFYSEEELQRKENTSFVGIGIVIDDAKYLFDGNTYQYFFKALKQLDFSAQTVDDITILYTKEHNNMYTIDQNFHRVKAKKIKILVKKITDDNRKPIELEPIHIKLSNDDRLAYIKNIITGKEQIIFESGKIEEI